MKKKPGLMLAILVLSSAVVIVMLSIAIGGALQFTAPKVSTSGGGFGAVVPKDDMGWKSLRTAGTSSLFVPAPGGLSMYGPSSVIPAGTMLPAGSGSVGYQGLRDTALPGRGQFPPPPLSIGGAVNTSYPGGGEAYVASGGSSGGGNTYETGSSTSTSGDQGILYIYAGQTYIQNGGTENRAIDNSGTLRVYGSATLNGTVTNRSGSRMEVEGLLGPDTTVFNRDVDNHSTVKTTHTTVYYNGAFYNSGAYISDPSTQYFQTLNVNGGYLSGGSGDKFIIGRDFLISNVQNTLNTYWNTSQSSLEFHTGNDGTLMHMFSIVGTDRGTNVTGYTGNFAWYSLTIGANNSIVLQGAGTDPVSGALYVRVILGVLLNSTGQITNIYGTNGLNIYYDSNLTENAYLHGGTYNLVGGGQLRALNSAVPLPASGLLFGSGLAFFAAVRRRKTINSGK